MNLDIDGNKFFDFISRLDDEDTIAIISHNDPDGVCSAALASKVISPDKVEFTDYKEGDFKRILEGLREINKLLILDINLPKGSESRLKDFEEVVIIDHHERSTGIDMSNVHLINTKTEYPVAYTTYYLFSKIQSLPSWISAIGIISDLPNKYKEGNHKQVFDDFNLPNKRDLWDLMLDFGKELIYFEGREERFFEKLLMARKPEDLELGEVEEVDEEIRDWRERFEEEAEGDLIIFEMRPKFNIKGYLINRVSTDSRYKDKTIVFLQDKDSGVVVSVRDNGGDINCVKFLEKALKNVPSESGGHVNASGAVLPKKYKEKFIERLREVYGKI